MPCCWWIRQKRKSNAREFPGNPIGTENGAQERNFLGQSTVIQQSPIEIDGIPSSKGSSCTLDQVVVQTTETTRLIQSFDLRGANTFQVISTLTSIGCLKLAQKIEDLQSRGIVIHGHIIAAHIDSFESPESDSSENSRTTSSQFLRIPAGQIDKPSNEVITEGWIREMLSPISCSMVFQAILEHPGPASPEAAGASKPTLTIAISAVPVGLTLVTTAANAKPLPAAPAPAQAAGACNGDVCNAIRSHSAVEPLQPHLQQHGSGSIEDALSGRSTTSRLRHSIPDMQVRMIWGGRRR